MNNEALPDKRSKYTICQDENCKSITFITDLSIHNELLRSCMGRGSADEKFCDVSKKGE